MSTRVIRGICTVLTLLVLLYILGRAVEDTREETKKKIIDAVVECYKNNYSILGPTGQEVIDCIKNVEL